MKYLEFCRHHRGATWAERLMALLDVSISMDTADWPPSRLAGAKEAQTALIEAKAARFPADEVGIVCFSDDARTVQAPVRVGSGAKQLKQALRRMETEGYTNITAGLKEARKHFFDGGPSASGGGLLRWLDRLAEALYKVEPQPQERPSELGKVLRIVLLTDGEHNTGPSPVRVARKLKEAGVIIDCIGIGGSPKEVDEKLLKTIASRNPDGSIRYCFIGDKEQLIQKYEQLANRLRWG